MLRAVWLGTRARTANTLLYLDGACIHVLAHARTHARIWTSHERGRYVLFRTGGTLDARRKHTDPDDDDDDDDGPPLQG